MRRPLKLPVIIYPGITLAQARALMKRLSIEIKHEEMTDEEHDHFVAALGEIGNRVAEVTE